jgi:hypothetical protein
MARPLSLLLLGLMAAACAGVARGAPPPNITGMWQYDVGDKPDEEPEAQPPVTPEVAKLLAMRRDARLKGYVRDLANMQCLPTGFPQLMTWRSPIMIMQGFGRISIVTEHDPGNDEPRTVYLNEKTHPADLAPSWEGHSIGHWEGQTLVVDTIGFNDRANYLHGVPRSEKGHVVERFHLTKGGKVLLDDMTMTDPESLTKPWTVTLKFTRLANTEERLEAVCEPDLEALKKIDPNQYKVFDVEARYMTDPSKIYNLGGD